MEQFLQKTNVTMHRPKMRAFKRHMLDWEEKYEFPRELKESHCVEAMIEWLTHADTPESITAYAEKKGYNAEQTEDYREQCAWAVNQFLEFLSDVIETRDNNDGRKGPRT